MEDMYICLCNSVKLSEIKKAMGEGITTLEALQDELEVAINCGACTRDVLQILETHEKEKLVAAEDKH